MLYHDDVSPGWDPKLAAVHAPLLTLLNSSTAGKIKVVSMRELGLHGQVQQLVHCATTNTPPTELNRAVNNVNVTAPQVWIGNWDIDETLASGAPKVAHRCHHVKRTPTSGAAAADAAPVKRAGRALADDIDGDRESKMATRRRNDGVHAGHYDNQKSRQDAEPEPEPPWWKIGTEPQLHSTLPALKQLVRNLPAETRAVVIPRVNFGSHNADVLPSADLFEYEQYIDRYTVQDKGTQLSPPHPFFFCMF